MSNDGGKSSPASAWAAIFQDIGKGTTFNNADTTDAKASADDLDDLRRSVHGIFDPNDPDIKNLAEYWQTVLREEVFPAFMHDHKGKHNIDPDTLDIVIYKNPESAAMRLQNTNVIGVTIDSLEKAETLGKDYVIALLSHELLHRALDFSANDKIQEGLAEYRCAATLHRAGYSPIAGMRPSMVNVSKMGKVEDRIDGYKDEHVSSHFNNRFLNIAISRLRNDVGALKEEPTPVDEEGRQLLAVVQNNIEQEKVRNKTQWDKFLEGKEDGIFDRSKPVEKLALTYEFLNEHARHFTDNEFTEFLDVLKGIDLDQKDEAQQREMARLVDLLVTQSVTQRWGIKEEAVKDLFLGCYGTGFFSPYGFPSYTKIGQLTHKYYDLMNADSYEAAIAIADDIEEFEQSLEMQRVEDYNFYYSIGWKVRDFTFKNPLTKADEKLFVEGSNKRPYSGLFDQPVVLPWQKHIEWAGREAMQRDDGKSKIAATAFRFSYFDARLTALHPEGDKDLTKKREFETIKGVRLDSDFRFAREQEIRNEQGHLLGKKLSQEQKEVGQIYSSRAEHRIESAIIYDRRVFEEDLIEQTDWSELRTNPIDFFNKYGEHLLPHIGRIDFDAPFLKRFTDEVLAYRDSEPDEKYEHFIKALMRFRVKSVKYRAKGDDPDDTIEGTVLDLISNAYEQHSNGSFLRMGWRENDVTPGFHRLHSIGISDNSSWVRLVNGVVTPEVFGEYAEQLSRQLTTQIRAHTRFFRPARPSAGITLDNVRSPAFAAAQEYLALDINHLLRHPDFKSDYSTGYSGTAGHAAIYFALLVANKLEETESPAFWTINLCDGVFNRARDAKLPFHDVRRYRQLVSSKTATFVEDHLNTDVPDGFNALDIAERIEIFKTIEEENLLVGNGSVKRDLLDQIISDIDAWGEVFQKEQILLVEILLTGGYEPKVALAEIYSLREAALKDSEDDVLDAITSTFNRITYHTIGKTVLANTNDLKKIASIYVNGLIDNLKQQHGNEGLDHGDMAYQTSVMGMVANVTENFDPKSAIVILDTLSNKAEFQKKLAFSVEDQVIRLGLKKGHDNAAFGPSTEALVDFVNSNEPLRLGLIKFIKNEMQADSAANLAKLVSRNREDMVSLLKKLSDESDYKIDGLLRQLDNDELEIMLEDELIEMHRNFWALSMEMRGVAMDLFVFPADQDFKVGFDKKKKEILDDLFPSVGFWGMGEKDNKDIKRIARYFVGALLDNSDIEDQRLILSHLYVAGQPGEFSKLSVGKTLKEVLSLMKPVGDRIAQAIASHPEVPEYIKADLRSSKVMAGEPTRADSIRNLEASLETSIEESGITRIGKRLGEGAIAAVFKLDWQENIFPEGFEQTASASLKPDVGSRGAYRFDQIEKTIADVLKRPRTQHLLPIKQIVEQAKRTFFDEIDMDKAEIQAEIASDLYDGVEVKVGDRSIHFSSAPWLGHKAKIKHTGVIEGQHFLDLPENTVEEQKTKKVIAKAILNLELRNLLAGGHFDNDRHDGQQRILIDGNDIYIGNFDFGGIILTPPSPKQKRGLATAIKNSIVRSGGNVSDFARAFNSEIKNAHGTKHDVREFLIEFNRALLALENYREYLSNDEFKETLLSILNETDLDIANLIRQEFDELIEANKTGVKLSQLFGVNISSAFKYTPSDEVIQVIKPTVANDNARTGISYGLEKS